jgi:hypothetical protein
MVKEGREGLRAGGNTPTWGTKSCGALGGGFHYHASRSFHAGGYSRQSRSCLTFYCLLCSKRKVAGARIGPIWGVAEDRVVGCSEGGATVMRRFAA